MATSVDIDTILALPDSIKASLPAYPAPPGKLNNLTNPPNNGPRTVPAIVIFMVLALFFLISRLYSKAFLSKKLSWDDCKKLNRLRSTSLQAGPAKQSTVTCVLAFLFATIESSGFLWGATKGPLGIDLYNLSIAQLLSHDFTIASWLNSAFATPAIAFTKITIFLFYLQVFYPLRWFRIAALAGLGFTVVYYTAMSITWFVLSTPRPGETFAHHLLTPELFMQSKLVLPNAAIGLALDIYLFLLPIKAVMTLQLPRIKKIGVLVVFMTGFLAIVCSLVSMTFRAVQHDSWLVVELTAILEAYVGIIVACMPPFAKLLRQHLPPLESVRETGKSIVNLVGGSKKSKEQSQWQQFGDEDVTLPGFGRDVELAFVEKGAAG